MGEETAAASSSAAGDTKQAQVSPSSSGGGNAAAAGTAKAAAAAAAAPVPVPLAVSRSHSRSGSSGNLLNLAANQNTVKRVNWQTVRGALAPLGPETFVHPEQVGWVGWAGLGGWVCLYGRERREGGENGRERGGTTVRVCARAYSPRFVGVPRGCGRYRSCRMWLAMHSQSIHSFTHPISLPQTNAPRQAFYIQSADDKKTKKKGCKHHHHGDGEGEGGEAGASGNGGKRVLPPREDSFSRWAWGVVGRTWTPRGAVVRDHAFIIPST